MRSCARPAGTMPLGALLLATPTAAWSEPPWGAVTSTLPQRDLGKCSGLSTLVRLQRLCPLLACLPSSHVVLLAPLSLPSQQCHDQTSPNGLCAIARDCRLDEVDRLSVVVLLSRGPSWLWRSAELGTRGGRGGTDAQSIDAQHELWGWTAKVAGLGRCVVRETGPSCGP